MRYGMPCKFSKDESEFPRFRVSFDFIRLLSTASLSWTATIATRTHVIKSSVRRSPACWSGTVYHKWTREAHVVSIPPDGRGVTAPMHCVVSPSAAWCGLFEAMRRATGWANTYARAHTYCTYCLHAKCSNSTLTHTQTDRDLHIHTVRAKNNSWDTPVGNILHRPLLKHTL